MWEWEYYLYRNKFIFIGDIKSVGNERDLFSSPHVRKRYFISNKKRPPSPYNQISRLKDKFAGESRHKHHLLENFSSSSGTRRDWLYVLGRSRTSEEEKRGGRKKADETARVTCISQYTHISACNSRYGGGTWESLCNAKGKIFLFLASPTGVGSGEWSERDTNVRYRIAAFFFPLTLLLHHLQDHSTSSLSMYASARVFPFSLTLDRGVANRYLDTVLHGVFPIYKSERGISSGARKRSKRTTKAGYMGNLRFKIWDRPTRNIE